MAKRILVVDDDENILSLERTILEQKGFQVTTAGGGEALAEGFESGAVMYINKPFTANKLLTIVNTMLEQAEGQ